MADVSVIYWSGTGNTESIANEIKTQVESKGKTAELVNVESATADHVSGASYVALGCPSMGAEVLEDVMDEFVDAIDVTGKPVVLFGSYDWGDGQWMRDWQERMESKGAVMKADGLTINLTPEEDDLVKCRELADQLLK